MILKLFLFWRIGLFLVTYLGSITLPKVANTGVGAIAPGRDFNFWLSWAQWDGGHYLDISNHWYTKSTDFAFFPLFPFTVKLFGQLLGENYLLSGLLISNVSFVLFLFVFYKLVKQKFSQKVASFTVTTFLVFPTTFFASALYSEALFLLIVVLAFRFLNEKKFLFASVCASLASLTRLVGVLLTISIVYSYLANIKFNLRKMDKYTLHIIISFFGFTVYCLYLFAKFRDPFKFLTSQSFWQRQISDPVSTIAFYIWRVATEGSLPLNVYFDLGLTLLFLTLLVFGIKKIPSSLWIFSTLVILIPASSGTLTSMPRYLLSSLGTFIILGIFFENKFALRVCIWTASLIAQAILATLFVNGYWIA